MENTAMDVQKSFDHLNEDRRRRDCVNQRKDMLSTIMDADFHTFRMVLYWSRPNTIKVIEINTVSVRVCHHI
jgi:hypothetical protein